MTAATSIEKALQLWKEKYHADPTKAKDIGLQYQSPPIEEMDTTLGYLVECRKLSLACNKIRKISGISTLKNLRILSIGRNYLKDLDGIEVLADTLEELWVNYNAIEKIKPIEAMKALRVLQISHNLIKNWDEFNRMAIPPKLKEVDFRGNILCEIMDDTVFRDEAIKRLPLLKKLDGEPVIRGG